MNKYIINKIRFIIREYSPSILLGLLVLIVWQEIIFRFHVPSYIFPSPTDIIEVFFDKFSLLYNNTLITFIESALGVIAALIVSFFLGVLIGFIKFLQKLLTPYLLVLQTTPIIAVAPLLILWFGPGLKTRIVCAFAASVVPMSITIIRGMSVEDGGRSELLEIMGFSKFSSFMRVKVPLCIPYIFAALEFGVAISVVGAIVGELVTADAGLGYIMIEASYSVDTPMLFAALVCSGIIGVVLFSCVALIKSIVKIDKFYISER